MQCHHQHGLMAVLGTLARAIIAYATTVLSSVEALQPLSSAAVPLSSDVILNGNIPLIVEVRVRLGTW